MDEENLELTRLPGLYRAWELGAVLTPGAAFRIEAAGWTEDGTLLFAVYRGGDVEGGA